MNHSDFVVEYADYFGYSIIKAKRKINDEILRLRNTQKGKKIFALPTNNKKLSNIISYLIFLADISTTKDGRNKKIISIYKA